MLVVFRTQVGIWEILMSLVLTGKSGEIVEIDLPAKYKKVAVNCSGGADSSILLYILAKYIKDNALDIKLSVLTCSTDVKDRWTGRKAELVTNYIIENVGTGIIDMHYIYFRERPKLEDFHEIENSLFDDGRAHLIVSGITSNPPDGATIENINGEVINLSDGAQSNRDGADHQIWHISSDGMRDFWSPFANVDKKFIADQYDAYGVRDTLLPLTRSCEKKTPLDATFDPMFEETPCGICWWCLERKWAFGYF
jgi:hypothetical protein